MVALAPGTTELLPVRASVACARPHPGSRSTRSDRTGPHRRSAGPPAYAAVNETVDFS